MIPREIRETAEGYEEVRQDREQPEQFLPNIQPAVKKEASKNLSKKQIPIW